ncbi:MAG TPA: putative 4-mercaptohistidine N1-methyltransferase [Verrucomicrobiales bacterium]|jgi:putative 4-mercaptohistidine N1-methyltranferase|nr:putative 4-mercaptohistidine N1-methyltransferase [Verrucomicrobiales bacterium]HIL69338.1 putative 4-mercaptohistidine N1-methyltransferase [Verrucomicrobiota bacterium]
MSFYESDKAVSEYLLFHYGSAAEVLPYDFGPVDALNYPVRCISECLYPEALPGEGRALDLGCAVGRSSFEFARHFTEVIGIDYSHRFIHAGQTLVAKGQLNYTFRIEGDLEQATVATVPEEINRTRVQFEQGDAMNLRPDLGQFDAVLAANLIDRLPEPKSLLEQFAGMVKPGGQLILTSPYTWLTDYASKEQWLGGQILDGKSIRTIEAVTSILSNNFEMVLRKDLPFLIREHARKFQWSVAEATVWRRKDA